MENQIITVAQIQAAIKMHKDAIEALRGDAGKALIPSFQMACIRQHMGFIADLTKELEVVNEAMDPVTGVWARIAEMYAAIEALKSNPLNSPAAIAHRVEYIEEQIANMKQWAADHGLVDPAAIDGDADAGADAAIDAAIDAGADAAIDADAGRALWEQIIGLREEVQNIARAESRLSLTALCESPLPTIRAALMATIVEMTIDAAALGVHDPALDGIEATILIAVTRKDRPAVTIRVNGSSDAKDLLGSIIAGRSWEYIRYRAEGNFNVMEYAEPMITRPDDTIEHVMAYIGKEWYMPYIIQA